MPRSRTIPTLAGAMLAGLGCWATPAAAQYSARPNCLPPVTAPAPQSPPQTSSAPSAEPAPRAPDDRPSAADALPPPTPPSDAPGGMDGLFGNVSDASPVGGGLGSGDGPSALSSAVGYIDNAVVATQLRLRLDFAYNSNRPTRAEVFYPRGGSNAPGLPGPETSVDYQQLFLYYERAFTKDLSAFIDVPIRWINPELNSNSYGFSDVMAGVRYSFVNTPCQIVTGQLRVYAPTGDGSRGLGTEHASIEPGLLTQRTLNGHVNLYSELHYWQSLGGTDFAGNYLRYGVGASYGQVNPYAFWLTPVVEFVGWTVLDGKQAIFHPPVRAIDDATGDTIINAKFGARFGWSDRWDLYAGYGRALTGEVWYKDVLRLELRSRF